MSRVVAIGPARQVEVLAMVGVEVRSAETPVAVLRAFDELGDDVGLLLLSATAADAVRAKLGEPRSPLWAALP